MNNQSTTLIKVSKMEVMLEKIMKMLERQNYLTETMIRLLAPTFSIDDESNIDEKILEARTQGIIY